MTRARVVDCANVGCSFILVSLVDLCFLDGLLADFFFRKFSICFITENDWMDVGVVFSSLGFGSYFNPEVPLGSYFMFIFGA